MEERRRRVFSICKHKTMSVFFFFFYYYYGRTKSDFTELISPTDRTDVGRRNLYRLLTVGCRWRLGVGEVTDGRQPICTELVLMIHLLIFEDKSF
jgi:hypothetical protein